MDDPIRRETILTAVGLVGMTIFFLFVIYVPGQHACQNAESQIHAAEQMMAQVPNRVAELESLRKQLRDLNAYLEQTETVIPKNPDLQGVISDVARLADRHRLCITRLEPLETVERETIAIQTFQVALSGAFSDVVAFLCGLESQRRVYCIRSLTMEREDRGNGEEIGCEVKFTAFSRRAEKAGDDENSTNPEDSTADKNLG